MATMENSMEIPQKLGINYHMTQQSHYWVYTLRYGFIIEKDTCTHNVHCSTIYNS